MPTTGLRILLKLLNAHKPNLCCVVEPTTIANIAICDSCLDVVLDEAIRRKHEEEV